VVRVFNDRGQILVGVKVTEDARPGVMRIFEGGWYDPEEPGKIRSLCKYGDVNVLSVGLGTSKLAQGNTAQTIMAEAEKFAGSAPALTVFTAPASAS
jgi:trimethylamine-N-oxide reductase (cytochrome c)